MSRPAKFLLVEEAADRLQLKPAEVQELIDSGRLPALILDDGQTRIDPTHLRRFIRARTVPFVHRSRARSEITMLKRMWGGR